MKLIEILGIFAAVFELGGLYFLGKKKKIGFLLNIVAGISWITYSLITGNAIGLIIVCAVALFLNTKGFYHWHKDR